jgi:anti-sigma regulatory factor (Ser/Thr protein kinase)
MLNAVTQWLQKLLGRAPEAATEEWNFVLRGDRKEIGAINEALERAAAAGGVPENAFRQMQIALDELLTNAVSYGKVTADEPAKVDIFVGSRSLRAVIRYPDVPFNPFTDAAQPDTGLSIQDRDIGGLGVHLVKEMMDSYAHDYQAGHNILMVEKKF